jgi:signal transduction histidine kinase
VIRSAPRSIGSVPDARQAPAPEALEREVCWAVWAAIALFTVVGTVTRLGDDVTRALIGAAVAAVAGGWLVFAPPPQVLPVAAVMTVGIAVIGSGTSSNVAWFAVCMLTTWCVVRGRTWDGLVFWVAALSLFGAEWAYTTADPGWAAWSAGTTFSLLAAYFVRHQLWLMAELRVAQAGLLDSARAEERNRIARELHDVIAHSLTVSLLHVTSARVALEHAPADAADALAEAERIGQEALAEVRGTVGLLRQDGDVAWNRPQPGTADLAILVAGFRSAGADVGLTVTGDTGSISGTAGLTVYRIAQEALTNAVKHAPGSPVDVQLHVADGSVTLVVESAGPAGKGQGLGIIGMGERAAAVGGSCAAGPGGRGWVVRASIPSPS